MADFPVDVGGDPIGQRAVFERVTTAQPLPDDVITTSGSLGGVPTLDIATAETRSDAVLLWFHSGWYVLGSPRTAAALSSDVARRTGAKVVSVDYRLAPEHPYPAALQDARAAYRGLLDSGVRPQDVAMVGESAGGGLVASTLASLGEEGLPQPAAAVLFSPWADLTLSGESMTTKVGIDPAFVPEKVSVRVADYVGDADPADPAISPIFADLRGLPPLLIQAGSYEILLDDAVRLAARAAAADVPVRLEVTPAVPHYFQAFAAMLEEGDAALDNVARFLEAHLGATSPV
jgi:acetyl esterase/lipase